MAMVCASVAGGGSARANSTTRTNSTTKAPAKASGTSKASSTSKASNSTSTTTARSKNTASTVKPGTVTASLAKTKLGAFNGPNKNSYATPEPKVYSNKDAHTTEVKMPSGHTIQATGPYIDISKPVANKNGIYTGTQGVGIAEFKGHNKSNTFEWQINAVSASGQGGLGPRFTGYDGSASLFSGKLGGVVCGKYVGISGYAGGLSMSSNVTYEKGRVTYNIPVASGFGISITYGAGN